MRNKLPIILLFSISCRSIKFKKDYIDKRGEQLFLDYNTELTMIFSVNPSFLKTIRRDDKFLDSVSFNKLKKRFKVYERYIALHPDSTVVKQLDYSQTIIMIDAFYYNSNKIKYLKKYKIKSPNIYLVE